MLPTALGLLRLSCPWLLCALAVHSLAGGRELTAEAAGRIEFSSYTPRTMYDVARVARDKWPQQQVWGDLAFPKGVAGVVPAIVLMHGSGGIEASMRQWVEAFNDIGVATFVVSSFEPRGVARTAENQALVPPPANLVDAFEALQLLATHPRIDPSRIGVMGFSRGGEVAFRTAVEPFRRAVIKSELKFALHIPVYAGCNQVYWSSDISKAPILNLVGADDDYTTAPPCERLAQRYASAGAPVRTIIYPRAHHSWDAMYPVFLLPNATSGAPCGVLRWDIEPWTITAEATGSMVDPGRLEELFKTCVRRGVHVGRNEAAFRQSRSDAQAFVREVFRLPSAR